MVNTPSSSRENSPQKQNNQPRNQQPQMDPNLMRVTAKIPPFWEEHPEVWFAQVEAQFTTAAITSDDTKFAHLVGNLNSKVLSKVSDIILHPPTANKYKTLKDAIILAFAESDQKKSSKLLSEMELGDRRPSELLSEMKRLAGGKINDQFMRTLWNKCLPKHVSEILATSDAELTSLAKMADKIMEVSEFNNITAIASSHLPTSSNGTNDRIARLEKKVDDLTKCLNKISTKRSRSRSKTPATASTNDGSSNVDKPFCWYHFKYGESAHKCVEPCKFKQKN
jgi:hypothetical protein